MDTSKHTCVKTRLLALVLTLVLVSSCLVLPTQATQSNSDEAKGVLTYAGEGVELISHTETKVSSVDSTVP